MSIISKDTMMIDDCLQEVRLLKIIILKKKGPNFKVTNFLRLFSYGFWKENALVIDVACKYKNINK